MPSHSNYGATRTPHESGYGLYPAFQKVGIIAGGAGDAVEVVADWVSVTGLNATSLTAHGNDQEQLEALELMVQCRLSVADAETFVFKALKIETAPPDSSGDPDAGSLVLIAAITRQVDLIQLAATPKTDLEVGVTASVQDDILVLTSDGGDTDTKILVRLSFVVRVPTGLNFFRVKITPDLSASDTDTADIQAVYGFVASHVPLYEPHGI